MRTEISVAMAETAIHDPVRRDVVIDWFSNLLQYWLSGEAVSQRSETEFKGLAVCNLIDIRAVELISEISSLYEENLAWPGVAGPLEEHTKTGRNDSCPCESGKKYKKCCMNS